MIALVWNAPVRLVDMTVRYELFVEGLRAVGSDGLALCPAGCEDEYPYPVRTFADERELTNAAFWKKLGCKAVVIITWHRMTDILLAVRAAGLPVLAIGESDGQVSLRIHPWPTFRFMTYTQSTVRGKLGAAKHWLQRFLFRGSAEHQAIIDNTAASSFLALGSEGGVREFRLLLQRLGTGNLADRVVWIPYPVPEKFCAGPVALQRADRVIAVGRWDSLQKNPELLKATVRRLAECGSRTEILIVGKMSQQRFGELARNIPHVHLLGVQTRDKIHELMMGCRSVLISSRWEGSPVVANEMLALGGTVVGTPIPSLRGITADGRFGRVGRGHTAASLAAAVVHEMKAWDHGERDPIAISAHWRNLVSPSAVAELMLTLLGVIPSTQSF